MWTERCQQPTSGNGSSTSLVTSVPHSFTESLDLQVGSAVISRCLQDISSILNVVGGFRQKKFEKLLAAKVVSISYIPCPMKSALACALILRGGAEFGNKGLYSKFAVIGDAAHLQSPALDTPARCKRGLM